MMQEDNLRLTCRYGLRYDGFEMTMQINIVFQDDAALYSFGNHHLIYTDMAHGTAHFTQTQVMATKLLGERKVHPLQFILREGLAIHRIEK
jgi:hypothetical protein